MNGKLIGVSSAWILSLGGAFVLGKSLVSSSESSATATKAPGTSSSLGRLKTSSPATAATATEDRLLASPMIRPGTSRTEMIIDIARHTDPLERNTALLRLIDTLSPSDYESVVAEFRSLEMTERRRGEYALLLTAWAKVAPQEALDYASENTGGVFARNTILTAWTQSDPDAAIAWAEANHDNPEDGNPWLVGVIEGLAPQNIERATEVMGTMARSNERGRALNSIINELMIQGQGDTSNAKEWAEGIPDEGLRSGAFAFTAEAIARTDPAEAAKWLGKTQDVDAINRVGEEISDELYENDPEAAVAWVSTLPPAAMSEAAEGIISNLVRETPIEAAQYLTNLITNNSEADFQSSIRELAQGASTQDPEVAVEWANFVTNNRDRTRVYFRALSNWQQDDPNAASGWIQNNADQLPDYILNRFQPENN